MIKTKPVVKPREDAVEVREKRTIFSKTFSAPNNQFICQSTLGTIQHYTSDENELRTCDTTVQEDNGRIFVEWLPYKFELMSDKIGFKFESRAGGKLEIYLKNIGVDFIRPAPIIEENKITFPDVVKDLDIVFIILPNRVKSLRILKSAKAPRIFEWESLVDSGHESKIDTNLKGTDAAGNDLELSSETLTTDKINIIERWSGKVKVRDPITRIKSLSNVVSYPVAIDPTINNSVSVDADDGTETPSPTWFTSVSLQIGGYGGNLYHSVWRFQNITIPQGSTVSSATLTFKKTGGTNASTGTVWGNGVDNAAALSNSNKPSTMTKTSASTAIASFSTTTNNINVTSIVQEIVNRAGWVSGNAMSIFAIGSGSSGYAIIEDYSAPGTAQGSISITYTGASGSLLVFNRKNPGGFKALGL